MLDVTFPFVLNIDTALNVANEMMTSEIIEPDDVVIVASNIDDLIENFKENRQLMDVPGDHVAETSFEVTDKSRALF